MNFSGKAVYYYYLIKTNKLITSPAFGGANIINYRFNRIYPIDI